VVRAGRAAARRAARRLGAEGGELDDRPALGRRCAQLELRLEAPRADGRADRIGHDGTPRASVAAENQAAAGSEGLPEQALDKRALPVGRNIDELGADDVEAERRFPAECVFRGRSGRPNEAAGGGRARRGPPPGRGRRARCGGVSSARGSRGGARWHSRHRGSCRHRRSRRQSAAVPPPSVPRRPRTRTALLGCRPPGRPPRRSRPSPRTSARRRFLRAPGPRRARPLAPARRPCQPPFPAPG
jgi:hypothetical protein